MRKLLVPLLRPEDPILWGLLGLVVAYALAGAFAAWHKSRAHRRDSAD